MKNILTKFKNIALLGISVSLIMISCKKNEYPINTATEKVNNNFEKYDSLITSSSNGWNLLVFPDIKANPSNKGGFSFFVKFKKENQRMIMVGDYDKTSREIPIESAYDLKFTSLTTLSFSTYNYLHYLADPNTMINGGEKLGWGHRVDTEYSILKTSQNQDTIFLKGNLQNSTAILIRANSETEKYFLTDKKYEDLIKKFENAAKGKLGLHLDINNKLSVLTLALNNRQLVISRDINEDSVYVHKTGIAYSGINKIKLAVPYTFDNVTISELIVEDGKLKAISSDNKPVNIVDKEFPIIPAFKMIRTGAYTTLRVPLYDPLHRPTSENVSALWPNVAANNDFWGKIRTVDFGFGFAWLLGDVRLYHFDLQFMPAQKRLSLNLNVGIFDKERPNAPASAARASDDFFNIFNFPYQYRYIYNTNEEFTMYYEGPQFVYAAQFPDLKNGFGDAIKNGKYSLKYTKSPTQLLLAFYNKDDGKILFEGLPF